MKIDVGKIALVAVMIAGIQTGVLYHRIDDLECQRDIYKSRYEDWEGVSKEIAEYADTLRDSLKARDRLDGKLLVEDAGDIHDQHNDDNGRNGGHDDFEDAPHSAGSIHHGGLKLFLIDGCDGGQKENCSASKVLPDGRSDQNGTDPTLFLKEVDGRSA